MVGLKTVRVTVISESALPTPNSLRDILVAAVRQHYRSPGLGVAVDSGCCFGPGQDHISIPALTQLVQSYSGPERLVVLDGMKCLYQHAPGVSMNVTPDTSFWVVERELVNGQPGEPVAIYDDEMEPVWRRR